MEASKASYKSVFLAMVLYHGLNGLRGIILELTRTPKAERTVTGFVLAFGVVTFGLGIYVPVTLFLG